MATHAKKIGISGLEYGSMTKTGVYEYIVDSTGNVSHQLFKPDSGITGFPNIHKK